MNSTLQFLLVHKSTSAKCAKIMKFIWKGQLKKVWFFLHSNFVSSGEWPGWECLSFCNIIVIVLPTDYGRPERKYPSLQSRKFTPTPKCLGTAEAYFVGHIGLIFQISLIHASLGVRSPLYCQTSTMTKSKWISRKLGLMPCIKTILNCFASEYSAFKTKHLKVS